MEKIDRIPSQRNDATKVAIAMIAKDDSSKLIVRAFRWQDEWYDVRKIGDWNVSKLDMSKTKLFDTVKEAVAAAGISYLSSPPGKKLATVYGERFRLSGLDATKLSESALYKAPKYPADAVYEFVEDDSFHIYYYEDDPKYVKPAEDMEAANAKVKAAAFAQERAAKALEHAAIALKSANQASLSPKDEDAFAKASRRIPAGVTVSKERIVAGSERSSAISPDEANRRVDDLKDQERNAYMHKLRERLNAQIVERKKENQPIAFCLFAAFIPDAYPHSCMEKEAFELVLNEFGQAGWSVSWKDVTEIRGPLSNQTYSNRIELDFSVVNPGST
jgi:hypothetical protein